MGILGWLLIMHYAYRYAKSMQLRIQQEIYFHKTKSKQNIIATVMLWKSRLRYAFGIYNEANGTLKDMQLNSW